MINAAFKYASPKQQHDRCLLFYLYPSFLVKAKDSTGGWNAAGIMGVPAAALLHIGIIPLHLSLSCAAAAAAAASLRTFPDPPSIFYHNITAFLHIS